MNIWRVVFGSFFTGLFLSFLTLSAQAESLETKVFLFEEDNCQVKIVQPMAGVRGGDVIADIEIRQIDPALVCNMNNFRLDIHTPEGDSRPASVYSYVVDVDQPGVHWTISDFGDSITALGSTLQTENVRIWMKIHSVTNAKYVGVGYFMNQGYFYVANVLIAQNVIYIPSATRD